MSIHLFHFLGACVVLLSLKLDICGGGPTRLSGFLPLERGHALPAKILVLVNLGWGLSNGSGSRKLDYPLFAKICNLLTFVTEVTLGAPEPMVSIDPRSGVSPSVKQMV